MPPGVTEGVYTKIEDKVLAVLAADADIAASVKTFDAEGVKLAEDYNTHELPALIVQADGGTGEWVTTGHREETYQLFVDEIAEAGSTKRRRRAAKDLAADIH